MGEVALDGGGEVVEDGAAWLAVDSYDDVPGYSGYGDRLRYL